MTGKMIYNVELNENAKTPNPAKIDNFIYENSSFFLSI